MRIVARHHQIEFPRPPLVMGIVNINDDSFCGDGSLDVSQSLEQAFEQLKDGADIIDIGAESARTNRQAISVEEEIERLTPFLKAWPQLLEKWENASEFHHPDSLPSPLLSINTWRSEVIEAILPLGGDIINDISALPSPKNAELCAQHGAALLVMHSIGEPKVPHTHVAYTDILDELDRFFADRIAVCKQAGLSEEQIILDPGIDFAKQKDDNLAIYRHLDRFSKFHLPILLPVSRKTVIGQVLDLKDPTERDLGTVACIVAGMRRGAHIFRVHHVKAAYQAVRVTWALEKSNSCKSPPLHDVVVKHHTA